MRKIIKILLVMLISSISCYAEVIDMYELTLNIRVPRVYNNTTSRGYRKYQSQKIKGYLYVSYDNEDNVTLFIKDLVNKTHKIGGKNVTYETTVDNEGQVFFPKWNVIGDNATKKFTTPSVMFYIDCNPIYNIGADEPDNSLLLVLSGSGKCSVNKKTGTSFIKTLRGYASGTLGCGCTAYGHVSPTRKMGFCGPKLNAVDDISAAYGTWTAKYKKTINCGSCIICR